MKPKKALPCRFVENLKHMKKTILIFGGVLGVILCIYLVYATNLMYTNPNFKGNDIIGYASMVMVFSLTFFGIRNYRNKQLNGVISLGQAFRVGALIAFIGSTIYVVFWMFYYYLVIPDFLDVYHAHVIRQTTSSGASAAELAAKKEEIASFAKMYKNPLFVIAMTYMEMLPVGLVVAFISSLILKRKLKASVAAE